MSIRKISLKRLSFHKIVLKEQILSTFSRVEFLKSFLRLKFL